METKTRSSLLGPRGIAFRTVAALGLWTLLGAGGGCGGGATPREPEPTPTLAEMLDAMPPQARLDTLRVLVAHDTTDATLPFHAGNAYYELGSDLPPEKRNVAVAYYDSAVAAYRRAADLDSSYSRAYVNMGLALDAAGQKAEARKAFESAIAINPDDVLAYCHLGYLDHAGGRLDEAVRLYQTALRIDPSSAQAHYNLGLAFAEKKIFGEAMIEWEKVAELDPGGALGKNATENVRILRQYLEKNP